MFVLKKKLITVLLSLSLLVMLAGCANNEVEEELPDDQDKTEAIDFTAIDREGNNIRLSDYKEKIVFLNFWATWCPPCRGEMPEIQSVYEKRSNDIVILAVNDQTDPKEKNKEEVLEWIDENEYTFPVIFDMDGSIFNKYFIRSIPTTYVIDKEGYIYTVFVGQINEEKMTNVIDELIE